MSTRTYVKDSRNNVLGSLVEDSRYIQAFDKYLNYKGRYDKSSNYTYDRNLKMIGTGNLVSSLII